MSLCVLALFALWTAAVRLVDVQPVGPDGSSVGLAVINRFVHSLTGVHLSLYLLTDWLSLIPVGIAAGFALLGLKQWIERKHLFRVDRSLLALGGFYALVMACYLFFELLAVNVRPVLLGGTLEVSYPSSTTLLVLCVMPTAIMQLNARIQKPVFRRWITFAMKAFAVLMVLGRFISGVHWFSDIVGGLLLSAGLVLMYRRICESCKKSFH